MPILIFFNHGMPKARFPFFLPIDLTRKLRNIEIVSRKYFQDIFSDDSVFALFLKFISCNSYLNSGRAQDAINITCSY